MPSPKNASRTMAEVRAECIALGLTPKRSIAATEEHIAEMKAYWDRRDAANREAAAEARAAEKTARHAANYHSGAGLFMSAAAALGWMNTSPDLREQARSFDRVARNKPRASVPGSVRRRMQREASKGGN